MKYFWIAILFMCTDSFAEIGYEYPELLVSPLATENLKQYAKEEKKEVWTNHIWSQIPALLNLWTGYRAYYENDGITESEQTIRNMGLLSSAISGSWLVLTVGISMEYSPYKQDYLSIRKLPEKNKRQRLLKERRAEQVLYNAYSMGLKLKYAGALSNLVASTMVLSSTENNYTRIQAGFAAILSFLPFLFSYSWVDHYQIHQDYKKKIYGPLTQITPSYFDGKLGSQVSLTWKF